MKLLNAFNRATKIVVEGYLLDDDCWEYLQPATTIRVDLSEAGSLEHEPCTVDLEQEIELDEQGEATVQTDMGPSEWGFFVERPMTKEDAP